MYDYFGSLIISDGFAQIPPEIQFKMKPILDPHVKYLEWVWCTCDLWPMTDNLQKKALVIQPIIVHDKKKRRWHKILVWHM